MGKSKAAAAVETVEYEIMMVCDDIVIDDFTEITECKKPLGIAVLFDPTLLSQISNPFCKLFQLASISLPQLFRSSRLPKT
jgi:hypothetical protein